MSAEVSWEQMTCPPDLPEGEVHLWRADLSHTPGELDLNENDLSAAEREQAARFHFEHHRSRFILSHNLLRRLLGGYLGVAPAAVSLETEARGKPHLGGELSACGLEFNLAHSGEMAVFGFRRGAAIGVDVEHIHPVRDMTRLAARFFSKPEQEQLSRLTEEKKVDGFFKGWTCKEAFIKNTGDGLYFPLNQFVVDLDPEQPARLLQVLTDPQEASHWRLESFSAGEGYPSALAVRGSVGRVRYLDCSPEVTI